MKYSQVLSNFYGSTATYKWVRNSHISISSEICDHSSYNRPNLNPSEIKIKSRKEKIFNPDDCLIVLAGASTGAFELI